MLNFRELATFKPSSVLQPCKHLVSCLGLLRSRPDPFRRSKIEQDRTSTSSRRLTSFRITYSLKSTIKPVCEWHRANVPTRLQYNFKIEVFKFYHSPLIWSFIFFKSVLTFFLTGQFLGLETNKSKSTTKITE